MLIILYIYNQLIYLLYIKRIISQLNSFNIIIIILSILGRWNHIIHNLF